MASIYKRRGTYHVAFTVSGKRKYLNTKLKDTKENRVKANRMKADIEREIEDLAKSPGTSYLNLASPDGNMTIKEAAEKCLRERILGKSVSHQETFKDALQHFYKVIPEDTLISDIGTSEVAAIIQYLSEKLSSASVHTYIRYIKILFNFLVEEDYLFKSPIKRKLIPKTVRKSIKIFQEHDLEEILAEAKKRDISYYNCLMLLLLTGLRPVDLLALKIRDFNIDKKRILVNVSKTSKEFSFPMYDELLNFLTENLAEKFKRNGTELLFPQFNVEILGKRFRRILKHIEISKELGYNLKTFRKTFATRMAARGMALLEIKELLAHDSTRTTEKFYADVITDNLRNRINNL